MNFRIRLENVNLKSNSGPNSFANKLYKEFVATSCDVVSGLDYDAALCFIQDNSNLPSTNLFQRLDCIYFNTQFDFKSQNLAIKKTYQKSSGVIFQSNFNKRLTERYFGQHKNSTVIHNGADILTIKDVIPLQNKKLEEYDNVWCCASSWRPHKRLKDNIEYFLSHQGSNDCLVVAGNADYHVNEPNVFFVGNLEPLKLLSLYKKSKYFIHLAWLDHCPNVVVDARACGCKIICSSSGGTKEIAGLDSIVILEEPWNLEPVRLYSPPTMNFNNTIKNTHDSCYDMKDVAEKYINFMRGGS